MCWSVAAYLTELATLLNVPFRLVPMVVTAVITTTAMRAAIRPPGGLPAAAFGGPAALMSHLAPAGPVYQAGTLSGNPVAVAAGLTTLRHADDAAYALLDGNADRLAGLIGGALSAPCEGHLPIVITIPSLNFLILHIPSWYTYMNLALSITLFGMTM